MITAKKLLVASLAWYGIIVVSVLFTHQFNDLTPRFILVWYLILGVGCFGLAVGSLIALAVEKNKLVSLAALLLPILVIVTLAVTGLEWVHRICFQAEKAHFESAIARIRAAAPEERSRICGGFYRIDSNPPLRVVFPEPGRMFEDYTGIVYDPTGMVMEANRIKDDPKWNNPRAVRIRKLFGGTMVRAEHLEGPWYWCRFS